MINAIETYITNLVDAEESMKLRALLSHVEAFLSHSQNILNEEAKGYIEATLGVINYYLGYDHKAKKLLETSLLRLEQYKQKNAIKIAGALSHLGAVYRKIGDD